MAEVLFYIEPKSRHVCDNCDGRWRGEDLQIIADFQERVTPGCPCPSGECPTCGALCYPVKRATRKVRL